MCTKYSLKKIISQKQYQADMIMIFPYKQLFLFIILTKFVFLCSFLQLIKKRFLVVGH